MVTGSCLMSQSLLKLHLVCAESDLKAQPDMVSHQVLIDVSVLLRFEWREMIQTQSFRTD